VEFLIALFALFGIPINRRRLSSPRRGSAQKLSDPRGTMNWKRLGSHERLNEATLERELGRIESGLPVLIFEKPAGRGENGRARMRPTTLVAINGDRAVLRTAHETFKRPISDIVAYVLNAA
jgi:hypothetical protein